MTILGMEQSYQFDNLETLLKAEDIARILNVSKSFAHRLMQQGDIPTVRIRRCVRVRMEDLRGYIEANVRVTD